MLDKPLIDLPKKNEWTWNQQVDEAFQSLKVALNITHFLTLLDLQAKFCVDIDECN